MKRNLGEFELVVLLAALRLRDEGYGVQVAREIEARTGREVSRGSLYVTLDRLEKKGYLTSRFEARPGERGGRPKRFVRITPEGVAALRETRRALGSLMKGLEEELS